MILITGATGTVGRPLVAALHARGVAVRALTRDPSRAAFPAGVEVVAGDPSRPETIAAHLDGVRAVFLNSTAIRDACEAFAGLAKRHGATRLVALAAYNVEQDLALQPSRYIGDRNRECEAAVETSGLEWVSLRPQMYASMAVPLWAGQLQLGDTVHWPYADFAEAVVDPRDVAEVAAHALVEDDLLGRKPVLTGAEALTHAEMVSVIGEVTGRRLEYRESTVVELVGRLAAMGLPPELAASFVARYAAFEGQTPESTDEVSRILGRPARSYRDWIADHAAAFSKPDVGGVV
ncbi:NAD(P)H-binding protein [Glycomyces sp. TRM65418]|uniref:NAD(P)H-binding protein n=1 Tax=Glycomyces sp. TRM65418 TaxID=2867006 RepID=UPI001CE6E367|nr:NAD(P)H-binding protein [Glycomyces sp. TRM65418]MCC3763178.1 NAD(P)H-binding protein [Glycomyces sp. TRM65418]QZD57183.1 NAD(P)H-binding protein [Glycomyces sp. TRM65418]